MTKVSQARYEGNNYSTHVQYDRHYSKSHVGTYMVVILFVAIIAYAWLYVPTFHSIVTSLFTILQ